MALELSHSKIAVCSQGHLVIVSEKAWLKVSWGKREACLDRLERLVCPIKQSLLEPELYEKLTCLLITCETRL